jgi:hypothetical protein
MVWTHAGRGPGTSVVALIGVASDANLINLRVLDANGEGKTSYLLAALNWIELPTAATFAGQPQSGTDTLSHIRMTPCAELYANLAIWVW